MAQAIYVVACNASQSASLVRVEKHCAGSSSLRKIPKVLTLLRAVAAHSMCVRVNYCALCLKSEAFVELPGSDLSSTSEPCLAGWCPGDELALCLFTDAVLDCGAFSTAISHPALTRCLAEDGKVLPQIRSTKRHAVKCLLLVCMEMDTGFLSLMSLRQGCGPRSPTCQGNIMFCLFRIHTRPYQN